MNKLFAIAFNLLFCVIIVFAKELDNNGDSVEIILDRQQKQRLQHHQHNQHQHHNHHQQRQQLQPRRPTAVARVKPFEFETSRNFTDDASSNLGLESHKSQHNSTRSLKLRRVQSTLPTTTTNQQRKERQQAPPVAAITTYSHRARGNNFNHRSVRNFATRNSIPGGSVTRNDRSYNGNGNGGGYPPYNVRPVGAGKTYPAATASSVNIDNNLRRNQDHDHIANRMGLANNEWMTPQPDTEFITQPAIITTTSTTTENPFATNFVRNNGGGNSNDPKSLESRHICMQQRTIQMPVKTTEVYTRPIWKHVSTPCQPQTQMNQMCTRVELIHEPAYRDVIRHKATKQIAYDCCPGWTRSTKLSSSCMKPVCNANCRNGGTCVGPDTCSCPPGYSGLHCENDINECQDEKPCDQLCLNTEGSYYCKCRDGFALQSDKQSCRKINKNDDDAFEARDLENEVDSNEEVTSRLHKIERTLANERIQSNELQKSLQATHHLVDSLKGRLTTLEKQQHDINHLQSNVMATESRTRKLESMISLLFKCRTTPGPYCP